MFLTAIIVYLGLLLAIGIYKTKAVKTQEDFMVAGRTTPVYKLVGTLLATWIGSGSIIAGAGLAYRVGFSELWLSAGAWVAIIIVYFLAGRVRKIAQYTMPDILEQRYNKWARILGTITIVIAYVTIASYQFKGGAFILNLVAGIPVEYGIIITATFVVLFTALAGLISVVTMDIINGTLMLFGIALAVPIILNDIGGWTVVRETLPPDRFEIFGQKDFIWAMGVFFPTFFLLLGESSMYQKFFSAKDAKSARQAVIFWVIGTIIIETSITALAVFASVKFKLEESEKVIIHLATHGGEIGLPPIVGIMLIVAAMAIIVSTANSFLLTPSTNLTRDIYQRFINPKATHKQIITLQRILIFVLGFLGYLLLTRFQTVLQMALTAYTMIGAGLTPALLAAFLWKRVTTAGGVASIATGMGITLIITLINMFREKPLLEADYIVLPAAAGSILVLVIVSLLTPPDPPEKWKPFVENKE